MIRFNDNIDNKYLRLIMILITDADSPSITNLLNNKYLLSGKLRSLSITMSSFPLIGRIIN